MVLNRKCCSQRMNSSSLAIDLLHISHHVKSMLGSAKALILVSTSRGLVSGHGRYVEWEGHNVSQSNNNTDQIREISCGPIKVNH